MLGAGSEPPVSRERHRVRDLTAFQFGPNLARQLIHDGGPTLGPVHTLDGVVLKRHNGDRLLVSVRFLQQGASVALEDYQVEEIG